MLARVSRQMGLRLPLTFAQNGRNRSRFGWLVNHCPMLSEKILRMTFRTVRDLGESNRSDPSADLQRRNRQPIFQLGGSPSPIREQLHRSRRLAIPANTWVLLFVVHPQIPGLDRVRAQGDPLLLKSQLAIKTGPRFWRDFFRATNCGSART